MEKLLIFNLDVLSMVLYRRSLETTVKIRLKTRSRSLNPNPENTRELLTPGNINRQDLIKRLHTYTETKHQPRAKSKTKTSSRARPTTQILQKHRKITLSFNIQTAQSHTKPTDISKFTTAHFLALQRKEIQLHPPEH